MSRDLMHTGELKALVRDAYAAIDSTTEAVAYKLHSTDELAQVPRSAIERGLGVANHLRFAQIEEGEAILDLGCGAGEILVASADNAGWSLDGSQAKPLPWVATGCLSRSMVRRGSGGSSPRRVAAVLESSASA